MFSCNSASKAQLSPESSSSKRQEEHSLRGQSGQEGWGLQAKALGVLELLNFGGAQAWVERASRRLSADVGVRIDYELGGTGLSLSRVAVGVPEGWKASSQPPCE